MDIAAFLKELFANYGAAALPWSVVAYLFWQIYNDKSKARTIPDDLEKVIDHYHEAIVGNTRAIERLAILLEERTSRQSRPK